MDDQLTLRFDGQRAVVCRTGGRVSSYQVDGAEVLAGKEDPTQHAFRGALLAPWPNRVVGGRWSWLGTEHQLPVNDAGTDAALHGLVIDRDFEVRDSTAVSVTLTHALQPTDGYPYPLLLEVTYSLSEQGLAGSLTATNSGDAPVPVGLGVHPYLEANGIVDDLVVMLPGGTEVKTDDRWRETGRVPVTPLHGALGPRQIDAAFTDLSTDEARVRRPDGLEVLLRWGPTARWLVVYTGDTLPEADRRRSIAIEPQTCPPNGLATGELDVLEPGASLTLEWSFSVVNALLA
jgi:aldose 1-epimerase